MLTGFTMAKYKVGNIVNIYPKARTCWLIVGVTKTHYDLVRIGPGTVNSHRTSTHVLDQFKNAVVTFATSHKISRFYQ